VRLLTILFTLLAITACKPSLETSETTTTSLIESNDEWEFGTRAYTHTAKILSFGPRPPESTALASTRAYIIAELAKHKWTSIKQPLTANTPKGKTNFENVIARYAPAGPSKAWSRPTTGVLAAHFDSKLLKDFLGADDAASAVGAILEIAEYLHKHHPKTAQNLELVFFDGEESIGPNLTYTAPEAIDLPANQEGLYGSHHYAKTVRKAANSNTLPYTSMPKFGIVLDMIGHKNLNIKIPVDTPEKLLESYKKSRKTLAAEKHFGISDTAILDDHYPMNIFGIPTIDIIGDFRSNKWWHTTDDNLDIISKPSLSLSMRMTLLIIEDQL